MRLKDEEIAYCLVLLCIQRIPTPTQPQLRFYWFFLNILKAVTTALHKLRVLNNSIENTHTRFRATCGVWVKIFLNKSCYNSEAVSCRCSTKYMLLKNL